jgi:hypothetical protein
LRKHLFQFLAASQRGDGSAVVLIKGIDHALGGASAFGEAFVQNTLSGLQAIKGFVQLLRIFVQLVKALAILLEGLKFELNPCICHELHLNDWTNKKALIAQGFDFSLGLLAFANLADDDFRSSGELRF